jgi:putative inorganic carbon (hco3(-)) transporter
MSQPTRPAGAGLAPAGGLWPAHIPRPAAPAPQLPAGPPPQGSAPTDVAVSSELPREIWPWRGVNFTLVYIGLLGFIFTTVTYYFPLGDVSMAVALIGLLIQRDRIRVPPLLVVLGLFLLWAVIGFTVTRDPIAVTAKLQVVGKLWLIGLVAANALRTRAQIRFFMVFWLGCFGFFPMRGALFNYYIYHEQIFGRAKWNYVFNNPNDLAAYSLLQVAMALALLGLERKGPVRLSAILGLFVVPFVILLTKSRGAFVALAAMVLFVIAGQKRRIRSLVITVLIAVIIVEVAPANVLDRAFALKNIKSTDDVAAADEEGSAFQRYEIWKVARAIIRENPVVGVGLGAYPAAHARMARRSQFDPTALGRRDSHSLYLNLAAETGFMGAFLYLLAYLGTLWSTDVVRRRAKALLPKSSRALYLLEMGAIAYLIAGVFGSIAHVNFFVLHVIVLWTFSEVVKSELAEAERRARRDGVRRLPNDASRLVRA